MRRMFKMLVVGVTLLGFSGCTTRLVDFTLISTKNVDLSRAANFERGKSRIAGKDMVAIIIFIPTGAPHMKQAIDRAIEQVPGAVALVDGVVKAQAWWFIFGMSGYVVEGTPLIDSARAAVDLPSNFMIAKMDRNGQVKEFRYVSEKEYTQVKNKYIGERSQVKL